MKTLISGLSNVCPQTPNNKADVMHVKVRSDAFEGNLFMLVRTDCYFQQSFSKIRVYFYNPFYIT